MWVLIITSVIAIWLTYLNAVGKIKNGMWYAFLLLTIIQGIHYDYGSDYMVYYAVYKDIVRHSFDFHHLIEGEYYREPGWALLSFIFRPIGGFFSLVAAISVFVNFAYYNFIRKYVDKNLWLFSVALYLFMVHDFYVINMSMIRQGLTVAMCLSIFPWIEQRKIIPSVLVVLAASTLHSSALIFLPFVFVDYIPLQRARRYIGIGMFVGFILFFLNIELLESVFDRMLIVEEFNEYAETYEKEETSASFGIGFLLKIIPMFVMALMLIFKKDLSHQNSILLFLACLGTLIAPFGRIIQLISRIGIYFNSFSIAAIPMAYSSIRNQFIRYSLVGLLLLYLLYDYYLFFSPSSIYAKSYETFHTIFSVLFE